MFQDWLGSEDVACLLQPVSPEQLALAVIQPYVQGEVVWMPVARLDRAEHPPQLRAYVALGDAHPYPESGFVRFQGVPLCL
jgi:hypothetical protein